MSYNCDICNGNIIHSMYEVIFNGGGGVKICPKCLDIFVKFPNIHEIRCGME